MAPIMLKSTKSNDYQSLSPYIDDDNALSNNLICPRYADSDPTSAPPSPSSIESFDILDPVAWRRGYTSWDNGTGKVRTYWRKRRSQIIGFLLLLLLLIAGCATGAYFAVRYEYGRLKNDCSARGGGERCNELKWAKCVSRNGLGFCEGIL
ncbi:hypothetical protein BDV96DRAFT_636335 [Lophiotrema nucula]|uniref:Uncharacterized protein n=1 Tax=Lophiotrema nucula TaxID=690887 RepID=A0A6A5YQR6_9PLEO|nr:hypothetical protein BDV96DRAFT_636335 [Lophiotrema nucula]